MDSILDLAGRVPWAGLLIGGASGYGCGSGRLASVLAGTCFSNRSPSESWSVYRHSKPKRNNSRSRLLN